MAPKCRRPAVRPKSSPDTTNSCTSLRSSRSSGSSAPSTNLALTVRTTSHPLNGAGVTPACEQAPARQSYKRHPPSFVLFVTVVDPSFHPTRGTTPPPTASSKPHSLLLTPTRNSPIPAEPDLPICAQLVYTVRVSLATHTLNARRLLRPDPAPATPPSPLASHRPSLPPASPPHRNPAPPSLRFDSHPDHSPNPAKTHPAAPQEFFGKHSYCARGAPFPPHRSRPCTLSPRSTVTPESRS